MNPQWQSCINPWVKAPSSPVPRILLVGEMLNSLIFLKRQDEDSWSKTPLGEVQTKFCAYVAGEFYRIQFDSKLDLWKVPRRRGKGYQELLKMVSAEAELWVKTWRVLENMESMGRLPIFPKPPGMLIPHQNLVPLWLGLLIEEFELLMLLCHHVGEEKPQGAFDLRRIKESQNRSLQALENPFSKTCTQRFVDSAITIAGQDDQFRAKLYMPMVRQRMTFAALIKESKPRAFDQNGRMTRQGRKKIIKLKNLAQ
jgi:hypothetical protein